MIGGCPSLALAGLISLTAKRLRGLLPLPALVSRGRLCCIWLKRWGAEVGTGPPGEEASFKSSWIWGALSHASVMAERWRVLLPRFAKGQPRCCPRTKLKLLNSRLSQPLFPILPCFLLPGFCTYFSWHGMPFMPLFVCRTPTHPSSPGFNVTSSRSSPEPPPSPKVPSYLLLSHFSRAEMCLNHLCPQYLAQDRACNRCLVNEWAKGLSGVGVRMGDQEDEILMYQPYPG